MEKKQSILTSTTTINQSIKLPNNEISTIHCLDLNFKRSKKPKKDLKYNFGSKQQRTSFISTTGTLNTPGPGYYNYSYNNKIQNVQIINKKLSPFGTTSNRFICNQNQGPGPGYYSYSINRVKTQAAIISPSPTSSVAEQDKNSPGPGFYNVNSTANMSGYNYLFKENKPTVINKKSSLPKIIENNKISQTKKQESNFKINFSKNNQITSIKRQRYILKENTQKYLPIRNSQDYSPTKIRQMKLFQNFSPGLIQSNDHAYQSYININQNPGPGVYFNKTTDTKKQQPSAIFTSKSPRQLFKQNGNIMINSSKKINKNQQICKSKNFNKDDKWI